jgi:CRP/FNR family transcriptional regulator, cyclic AMP receptor protein
MSEPQHPRVTSTTASAFERAGTSKTFKRGETICWEGDPAGPVMLVQSGIVDIRSRVDDVDVSVATVGSGRLIGEIAVIDGGVRSATMVARTDVQLTLVDQLTMSDLLEREPSVALDVLRSVVDRFRTRSITPVSLSKDARGLGRVIVEFLDHTGIRWGLVMVADVAASELAVEANYEPQRFSSALDELQRAGLVTTDASRVAVADRSALERICREPVI